MDDVELNEVDPQPWLRFLGGLAALVAAGYAALTVALGVMGAFLATSWDYAPPRNDPSASVGEPSPPWHLAEWLAASLVEVAAFTLTIALLAAAGALLVPALRRPLPGGSASRATVYGQRVWAGGTFVLGALAAVVHARNWIEWHAYLDAHIDVPHFYEPAQFLGVPVLALLGTLPAWWLVARRRRARVTLST